MSSSHSHSHSHSQHQWKYDLFLSFRGEDTRDNFISHLFAALSDKCLDTFIDYKLRKGDEIAPALLQAIRESNVAVIVFSEDYASSSWCLDELVEIMECHETHGQIVIPVFYHVNPSDVRKQTGIFAKAFDGKWNINSDKVRKWKAALTRAANQSGWDSQVIRSESELVDQIVKDVLDKVNQVLSLPTGLERLVGINSRLVKIKNVLSHGPLDRSRNVGILGIWGMGGIGKTTIAEAIFSQISCQFDGCCFLKNFREESEKGGITKLLEELFSQALGDSHIKIYTSSIGPGQFLIRRLCRKQILVVLDDVYDPLQLESLVGDPCWFGPGSRIIVTSRDKHVFEGRANHIYEVQPSDDDASLQLFSLYAFKQNHPPESRMPLSNLVVGYSRGNPLVLKVLGSFLFGKNKNEWESAVNKLKKVPMKEIQSVLKISYDCLDSEQKQIFLHIACLFKDEQKAAVIELLNSCDFSTRIGLRVLIDRSLVSTSYKGLVIVLEMHDLLQEMSREIVREESKEPGKRNRLWDSEDIYQVLTKNTGTIEVEGISLDMSKVRREIDLNPKVFENMPNLKFLKFYNSNDVGGLKKEECKVHLFQGLDYLPSELRYLYWYGYPLEYLPANFHPENRVWIELPHSNIEGLCREAELESIVEHFSSFSQFSMVTILMLTNCKELTRFPNNADMKCLGILNLSGCSNLETFPEISGNLIKLYLCGTAIKEVPSSVQHLDRLIELDLSYCAELESLPKEICKLTRLKSVDLSECYKLKEFPEILETMDSLETLELGRTAIEGLPFSVDNLRGLKYLRMENCANLAFLPQSLGNLETLRVFKVSIVSGSRQRLEKQEAMKFIGEGHEVSLYPSWSGMSCLIDLRVRNCNLWQLPADLGCLSSLNQLDLSGNDFESIPESIKQLSRLQFLYITDCRRLQCLPELPLSLHSINAKGCISLEDISSLNQLFFESESLCHQFEFSYCPKLDRDEADPISRLRNRYFVEQVKDDRGGTDRPKVMVCYTGSRIPEWFEYQSTGDLIKIPLLSKYWLNDAFLGFALCLVLEDVDYIYTEYRCYFGYSWSDDKEDFYFPLNSLSVMKTIFMEGALTEHVVLVYDSKLHDMIVEVRPIVTRFSFDVVLFQFGPAKGCKVNKCGVIPLYAQDDEYDSRPLRELSDSSSSYDSDDE